MKRILAVVLTAVFALTILSSCHGAVDIQHMEITDIYGGGTRKVCIYSWVGNEEYISLGEKQAKFLREYLREKLGQDAEDYTITYEGIAQNDGQLEGLFELTDEEKKQGFHLISMTYSFADIDEYNRKTEQIYTLSEELAVSGEDENYGRAKLNEYSPATLSVENGEKEKYYKVSFAEKGQTSVGLTAWAMIALWQERDNTELWENGEVLYEPLTDDVTQTVYSALKTTVNVTVGDESKYIRTVSQTPVMGQATVVGVDYSVSGEIYSEIVPAHLKPMVSAWDAWAVVISIAVVAVILAGIVIAIFRIRNKKSAR